MAPFRQIARRRPKLLMLAALFLLTFQSLAVTLDWCLHDGADMPHLESGVAPCPNALPDCHDDPSGSSLMFSVSPSSTVAALQAVQLDWHAVPLCYLRRADSLDPRPLRDIATVRLLDPPDHGPPRLSGAIPGESARLLI